MQHNKAATLQEPRSEVLRDKLSIAGISRYYPFDNVGQIPDQWQSLGQILARLSPAENPTTYGVIYNGSDVSFDYLAGVELSKGTACPENLVRLDLAPQHYLVFSHPGHVANVRDTCDAIWSDWLPASDRSVIEAPWIEKYGESFNPMTGEGGLEIWIPVTPVSHDN